MIMRKWLAFGQNPIVQIKRNIKKIKGTYKIKTVIDDNDTFTNESKQIPFLKKTFCLKKSISDVQVVS